MRVTVTHDKGREEAMRRVDRGVDKLFQVGPGGGPVEVRDQQKSWNGDTMTFALTVKMGFFTAPVHGIAIVEDKQITVDVDLGAIGKFIPEDKVRGSIESGTRRMLEA
jgi:hypothetical protein